MADKTILLVDDDENLCDSFKDILEESGYFVRCAYTRGEGLRTAKELMPQVALLDERLPDGSGAQLLAELRELDQDCFCIIMTAYAELETMMYAIEKGVFHYLIKPVGPPELLHVLERAFETIRLSEEKRAAELALKESERRFREILERVRLASMCLDLEGNITFANDFLLSISGCSREEVLGHNWFDLFVPKQSFAAELKKYRELIASGDLPAHGQSTLVTKNKDLRRLAWNNTWLRNTDGEVIGLACVGEDTTERERAVSALRESEDRLRTILEHIQAGIVLVDASNYLIVDANPTALRTIGARIEDMVGEPYSHFFGDLETNISALQDQGGKSEHTDVELRRQDGVMIPVLQTVVSTVLHGKPHLVASFIDLTDRKALELEQLKAEKLESVGLLAGGIAHDFNNLLTAILGNITLAKMYCNPQETSFKRLSEAERASLRAKDLTLQLLTFASGGAPLKKTSSVGEIIREAANFVTRGSKSRCELHIPSDLWLAPIDEGQIAQVINNLVINADQALHLGGTIGVVAENVKLGEDSTTSLSPGRYVKITISDSGTGITTQDLKRIFDPYFTTKKRGSGLGLSTAYSIVRRHGGVITVDSQVGVGTMFSVYLPAAQEISMLIQETRDGVLSGRGKILVMDDEELIRELMQDLLLSLGYEPAFATEGREAVELYKQAMDSGQPFDAVIVDLTIPGGMGGREAVSELLALDPKVKAIVSSGYSNDPIMANYKQYGFVDVVAKPYGVQELGQVLHKVIHLRT